MPHRLSAFVLAGVVAIIASGCNSHATFPENNANNTNNHDCGNHLIEPYEECDFDQQGKAVFLNSPDCVDRGYASGKLGCNPSNCTVITSDCVPLEGCNPLSNAGCDGNICYYFPEADDTSCSMAGLSNEGEYCTSSPDCAAGLTCWENLCRLVCTPGASCPDEINVCNSMNWLNNTLGLCPLGSGPCNPTNGSGCSDQALACYYDRENLVGYCSPEGDRGLGSVCDVDTDCMGGHACLKLETTVQGFCVPLCDSTFDFCDNGSTWCAYSTGGTVGFCTEMYGCDPKSGTGCENAEQVCTITNPYGSFSCLVPGPMEENDYCDMFNLCSEGLFCAVEYDYKCHRPCDQSSDCTGGDECIAMPGWILLSGWLGYCRLP